MQTKGREAGLFESRVGGKASVVNRRGVTTPKRRIPEQGRERRNGPHLESQKDVMIMAKVTDAVAALAQPVVAAAGCSLWDVEYVKEAGSWFLRVYIDKEGGVSIDDCEAVSRPLSDALDEADPIEGSYVFEVSSAGADRALKKPEPFARFQGAEVEVKLYRARDGRKEFVGPLQSWQDGDVVLEVGGGPMTFTRQEIAQVRLYPRF